jgi:hypothetical protein
MRTSSLARSRCFESALVAAPGVAIVVFAYLLFAGGLR